MIDVYHLAVKPRALRWLAAASVGVGGFALAWWVAEGRLNADRPTAVSAAAILGLVLAVPLIWYASLESGAIGRRPRQSASFTARHRKVVFAVAVVAVTAAVVAGYYTR